MKVSIRNHDMINKINVPNGIEVGSIPRGVGLERMRWNGIRLIDLITLDAFHVDSKFILHCIPVPGSQLVEMRYRSRKRLWNDNGVYKIKTPLQIKRELNLQYRRSHYPAIRNQMGAIIKYLATQPNLPEELQQIIDNIEAVKEKYPIDITAAGV